MFRFVSANASQSIKPVLLNLRNNAIIPPGPGYTFQRSVPQFSYSTVATSVPNAVPNPTTTAEYESYIEKLHSDPLFQKEVEHKLNYFSEQIHLLRQYNKLSDTEGQKAFSMTFQNIVNSFDDKELRSAFKENDLHSYVSALSFSIYKNRTSRLSGKKNLDKDQYSSSNVIDEHMLRLALLKFSDIISEGELKSIVTPRSLTLYFNAMHQFQLDNELVNAWESGVNDGESGEQYLNNQVLSIVLPIAFNLKRFSYEEIQRIFEINTANAKSVHPLLLCSMGKISVQAGDYTKGLDNLEALLKNYEYQKSLNAAPQRLHNAGAYLGDLHLSFIGSCKDISIARHFFDKVIQYDLPYAVKLKVPHIQSLLMNCVESKEPFDAITYFWKSSISHYGHDKRIADLNSRYAILNNGFFKIFFSSYPELNTESFNLLKNIIKIYNQVKPVDEVFLNTLITNYSWKDKTVFNQLLENYSIYNLDRTQVSYRVCLKKMGEISCSNEELTEKWYENLISLVQKDVRYIPMADWAAIRDSTINSQEYKEERSHLYWSIVNHYNPYFQDMTSCVRFIKNWIRIDPKSESILNQIAEGKFQSELQFHDFNLTPNVKFSRAFEQAKIQLENQN